MKMKKAQVKGVLIFSIVLVIICSVIIIINLNPSTTGNVVKTFQNCRDVQVPYEEQEEYLKTEYYTETIPYEDEVPLEYISSKKSSWWGYQCALWNYKLCYQIEVTNIDTIGGTFEATCNFRTLNNEFSDTITKYVKPGNMEILECTADIDIGEDIEARYSVNPPTKTETKYKDVQRERQVTAYRSVTKYRIEEKCD